MCNIALTCRSFAHCWLHLHFIIAEHCWPTTAFPFHLTGIYLHYFLCPFCYICFLHKCSALSPSNLPPYDIRNESSSCIVFLVRILHELRSELVALDIFCTLSLVASQVSVMAFVHSSQNAVSHIFCLITLVICHWHLLKSFHPLCENFVQLCCCCFC